MTGKTLPPERRAGAVRIVRTLRDAGHEAWFVGGCVRDALMGRTPDDYDIATSACPEVVASLFSHTVPVGARFGVIVVVEGRNPYEVATFRADDGYRDGRRPERILPADAAGDVRRRDFTINGLLADPDTGRIIDHVGGVADIRAGIVRTIGDAAVRFAEDRLRMLRAVRFACSLGFALEESTAREIRRGASTIRQISAERIRDEMTKLLSRPGASRGMDLLDRTGLLAEILPEAKALQGVGQPAEWHPEGDVWAHTMRMLDLMDQVAPDPGERPILAWAVLLHDLGKAVTRSSDERGVHFYRHAPESVIMAGGILRRLRFSRADEDLILSLIRDHMLFMHVRQMRPHRLKRFLRRPEFSLHLALHRLDCLGSHGILDNHAYCVAKLAEYPEDALRPPRLLTGGDLLAMGFAPGPLVGRILRTLEDHQLNGVLTTADEARRHVTARWGDARRSGEAGSSGSPGKPPEESP